MTTRSFAIELVEAALRNAEKSTTCWPPGTVPNVATAKQNGWSFVLDVYSHPDEKRFDKLPGDMLVWHYRLSAKLHPAGRSSTVHDWRTLGGMMREIVLATAYPEFQELPEPIVPIESAHPNSAHHWTWHGDGSPVDATVVDGTRQSVLMVQRREMEAAVELGLSVPVRPAPKPERNGPCPCGSGKKFKRCHGGR